MTDLSGEQQHLTVAPASWENGELYFRVNPTTGEPWGLDAAVAVALCGHAR
jgi:hypothetical protein